jgi:hypothetical protein
MYLTEKFLRLHPPGTKVSHPQHGTARIVSAERSHIVVEWDSPMARIEQPARIDADQVPYMSRVNEIVSPQQARDTYAKKQYNVDHDSALRQQFAVNRIEQIIDAFMNDPQQETHQGPDNGYHAHRVVIPLTWTTDRDQTEVSLNGEVQFTMLYYDVSHVWTALRQYYDGHGWRMSIDPERIIIAHHQEMPKLGESLQREFRSLRGPMRRGRLVFEDLPNLQMDGPSPPPDTSVIDQDAPDDFMNPAQSEPMDNGDTAPSTTQPESDTMMSQTMGQSGGMQNDLGTVNKTTLKFNDAFMGGRKQ